MTLQEEYEKRIDRSGGPDACHPWWLKPNHHGYGQWQPGGRKGKKVEAHRWGYLNGDGIDSRGNPLGPLPVGVHVCHTCDNGMCQNQRHWFAGTQSDNMKDCAAKGRNGGGNPSGELSPLSKLTDLQIAEIRRRYNEGGISQQQLGAEYGVAQAYVSRLVRQEVRV